MDIQGHDTMWAGRPTYTITAGETAQFQFNVDNPANHWAIAVYGMDGGGVLDPAHQLVSSGDPTWDHRTNGGTHRAIPRDYYHTPDRYSGQRTFSFDLSVAPSTPEDYYFLESQIGGGDEDWAESETFYLHVLADTRTTLIEAGATGWGYLDNGSNQGTAWRERGYDQQHPPWETGQAQLGYGNDGEVTLVDFGPDANHKYATTYFRKWFDVPDKFATNLTLRMRYDDGAAVYLNGQEIVRTATLPADAAFDTYTGTGDGHDEDAWVNFDIPQDLVIPSHSLIAVEIHQVSPDSSDIRLDLELRGQAIPEPSAAVMLLCGLGASALLLWRRRSA